MRITKLIVWAFLFVTLVSTTSCGRGGDEATPTPSPPLPTPTVTPVPPKPGEWSALADFGEFTFTVNPSGTGITKVSFHFSEFECGPATLSGEVSVENPSLWTIADGQFAANVELMPDEIVIRGKFDETGSHASGTWEVSASGTICMGAWECRPAPTPFFMEVVPQQIEDSVPGQRCVFLVTVAEEGEGSRGEAVNISAAAEESTVAVHPEAITPEQVAEVTVIPDEGNAGKTLAVTISGERDGTKRLETASVTVDDPVPDPGGLAQYATEIRDRFIPWLAANHPEFGITSETVWTPTIVRPHIMVVMYYLFFSEEWEMGVRWHVTIPPHDWAEIYLRHRTSEVSPSSAFKISSLEAQDEPQAVEPEESVWR